MQRRPTESICATILTILLQKKVVPPHNIENHWLRCTHSKTGTFGQILISLNDETVEVY